MHLTTFTLIGALAAVASAAPLAADTVHERRDYVPSAWTKRDRLDSTAVLPVRIGLTQSNLDRGYELLMEV